MLALVPGAPAEELTTTDIDDRLNWIDSKFHVSGSIMESDVTGGEIGAGFEISGPNPFRELEAEDEKKLAESTLR